MVLILIFSWVVWHSFVLTLSEVLGLYGLIVALIMNTQVSCFV